MSWKTAAIIVTLATATPNASIPGEIIPPQVPGNIAVPAGFEPFLVGHATGTQNYICMPSTGKKAVVWTFLGPQATLFDAGEDQILTHYLSPNPDANGTPQATWQHSRDTSTVWAAAVASSTDPEYVAPGSIPWLLLRITGSEYGPAQGDQMTETAYIQRVNTVGGVAPSAGCRGLSDVGNRALVPYTTDYVFYR